MPNKAYRPWYIAWSIEFCLGVISVGAVCMAIGPFPVYFLIGLAFILAGVASHLFVSSMVERREEREGK